VLDFSDEGIDMKVATVLYGGFLIANLLIGTDANAFTLSLFGSTIPAAGWQTNTLSFDIDYTNCSSEAAVNAAVDAAVGLWNSIPNSNLTLARGSSVITSVSAVTSSSHAAGNPTIVCDPNYSTTLGEPGIQEVSPGVSTNGLAQSSGKIIYYAILLNAQSGAKANIGSFSASLTAVILAHEIGHVLGLGHSADINALMYYDASAKTTLNLSQDDVDGIVYLYPRNEPTSGGAFGCGTLASLGGKKSREKRSGSKLPAPQVELLMLILFSAFATSRFRHMSKV